MHHIDAIATLRESLDSDQQRFQEAAEATGPVRAGDPAGAITVCLAADGRVDAVDLSADWSRHHEPEALGAVVVATHAVAAGERLGAYLAAFAETDGGRRPRPAPPAAPPPDPGAIDVDPGRVMDGLGQLLVELDSCLTEALTLVERQRSVTTTGCGPCGVRAEVAPTGGLVSLEVDPGWLRRSTPGAIGAELTAAIRDAEEQAARTAPAAEVTEASGLGRLRRLADDPAALVRMLGQEGLR